MGKKRMHPIVIVGGVMVIVLLFFLFVPAILGSTAASSDLEKYNGSSQQGNDTVRIAHTINTYFVGLTGIPLYVMVFFVAIFCVIVVIIWAFGGKKIGGRKK